MHGHGLLLLHEGHVEAASASAQFMSRNRNDDDTRHMENMKVKDISRDEEKQKK